MYNKDDVTRRRSRTPSFSSTLLDSICRSIDESNGQNLTEQQLDFTATAVKNQRHRERSVVVDSSWMEKQSVSSNSGSSIKLFTNSSISDNSSSGGGVTSSSEESSCYREKSRHCYEFSRHKPKQSIKSDHDNKQSTDSGGGFSRKKLKALKIYGELLNKKVLQPISPGGRISNFLNSIFNSGSNTKKASMCSSSIGATEDVSSYDHPHKSNSKSTRSCLSQTPPPSSGNNSKHVNGVKRTVRFYPVNVIVDEDSRPCSQKRVCKDNDPKLMPLPTVRQKIKSPTTRNSYGVDDWKSNYSRKEEEDDDEDEDDMLSCSSSDLFEIDHIVANDERYREELPVFETTNIKTNRAIGSGFIRRM